MPEAGAVSLLGLDLPRWFQIDRAAAAEVSAKATNRPRAKACIFLFMWGGPAHQDTWDMKPNAPVEFVASFNRSTPMFRDCKFANICRCWRNEPTDWL